MAKTWEEIYAYLQSRKKKEQQTTRKKRRKPTDEDVQYILTHLEELDVDISKKLDLSVSTIMLCRKKTRNQETSCCARQCSSEH